MSAVDARDELEFGGTGCLWSLLSWIPFLAIGALAGILTLLGLPGDLIVYGSVAVLVVWLAWRWYERHP